MTTDPSQCAELARLRAENVAFGKLLTVVSRNGDGDTQESPASPDSLQLYIAELQDEWDTAEKEKSRLRADSLAMAERIAAQAELLAKRAEAVPTVDLDEFTGHTPGPWAVERRWSNECEIVPRITCERDADRGCGWVADVIGAPYLGHQSTLPNARLIAAAPRLLAEVRRLRADLASVDDACSVIVRHTKLAECDGCGCVSMSPAWRAAYLARDYERLRAANAELAAALRSIAEYWNRDANHNAMLDACQYVAETAEAALARHAAPRDRIGFATESEEKS